ncbi:MAG: NAD(P)-dependent oxidoreductase [Luminiphilus sp.]|nr:NAD(P)-dependent oxidoreductase [Luminiphilus sp.]
MRILLLGSDTPIGYSLRAFVPPLQRHELIPVPLDATRWTRQRHAKKMLKTANADLVLDARLISLIDRVDALEPADIQRSEWLGMSAAGLNCHYLLLSSSRVFSGDLKRPYRESDRVDASDELGGILIEAENQLRSLVDSLFVLRLGWVFSGRGPSAFNRILDRLRDGEDLRVSDNRRDCPVHSAEVARVAAGVIDQIGVGAPGRGLFHYGSQGDTGYFSFVEAAVACASQFARFGKAQELLVEDATMAYANRSLDCTQIRHQFGIQQRPWRDFVERAVRRYIQLYCEEIRD